MSAAAPAAPSRSSPRPPRPSPAAPSPPAAAPPPRARGPYGRIWGARKDGAGGPFEVLAGAGPARPNPAGGLHALDLVADGDDLVFSADAGLWRVRKSGGAPRRLTSGRLAPLMLAADGAFLREYVYWASWEEGGPLRRAPKDGSAPPETLLSGLRGPEGIAVDERHIYVANKGFGEVLVVPKAGVDGTLLYPPAPP